MKYLVHSRTQAAVGSDNMGDDTVSGDNWLYLPSQADSWGGDIKGLTSGSATADAGAGAHALLSALESQLQQRLFKDGRTSMPSRLQAWLGGASVHRIGAAGFAGGTDAFCPR